MARILAISAVALLSFAVAAGGSIFYQKATKPETEPGSVPLADNGRTEAPTEQRSDEGKELPLAVRPPATSPEEMVRFSLTMGKREEALKKREEELRQKRIRLKIVEEDIRTAQRELEGLEAQVRGKIGIAQDTLKSVIEERQSLKKQQAEAAKELTDYQNHLQAVDDNETENIKRMSTWFQAMVPEKSAEYLSQLVNDGEMDMAAQILGNLDEREASKVLAAIQDPGLVTQLIDRFKSREQVKKKKP